MNKYLSFVFCCLIIFMAGLSVSADPHLTLSATEFDFGYTPQGSRVSCPFWLYSDGDEDLVVVTVKTDCGCTKAPLEKEVIAPGDSARLEIIFHSQRFSRKVVKHTKIRTNASPLSEKATIKAYVVTDSDSTFPLVVNPFKLDFSEKDGRIPDRIEFDIMNLSDEDLNIAIIDSLDDYANINLPGSIKKGESISGSVSLKDEGKAAYFNASFTFELDDAENTRYTVAILREALEDEKKPFELPMQSR